MRIKLITWLLLLVCPLYSWATEINTLRFTVNLEDQDGIYIAPQPVAFSVHTTVSDTSTMRLVCIVTTDTYQRVDSLAWCVKGDSSNHIHQQITLNSLTAGFYRISVYAENGTAKSPSYKFNIGYNPEQIVSPTDAKADFAEFWKKTRAELEAVTPHFKMTLLKEQSSGLKNIYHVEMVSLGHVKIEGYYSVPKKAGKHPAIIRFMGYGAKPRLLDPNNMPDFCEFILSVRGQGIQKSINPYGDWIVYGLQDKDTYYYRGAYMDLIRGVDFLSSRREVDQNNIMAEGASQGGAFTLAACALDKRIKAAAPRVPFLSDFRDYFNICPWPRSVFEKYLQENPTANWEQIYDLLSYFDIKNLAGQITCPLVMGVGLQDETCPPHTNFAGYNQIRAEKKYIVYPFQKHNVGESWWPMREDFFKENVN